MRGIKVRVLEESELTQLSVEVILGAGNEGYKQVVHYQDSFIVVSDTYIPKYTKEEIFTEDFISAIADYVFHNECNMGISEEGIVEVGNYRIEIIN